MDCVKDLGVARAKEGKLSVVMSHQEVIDFIADGFGFGGVILCSFIFGGEDQGMKRGDANRGI